MARDPICGMEVDPAHGLQAERGGTVYFFCCTHCRDKFMVQGTGPAAVEPPPPPADARYTCPMHPEVDQEGPGDCPFCGMALEPTGVALTEDESELHDMTRRFWIALVLTVPVFILSMGGMLPGDPLGRLLSPKLSQWLELLLASPVVLWAGFPFLKRAHRSFLTGNLNMFTLVAVGTGAAYLYSVGVVLFPDIFPESFHLHDGTLAVYFEGAAQPGAYPKTGRPCSWLFCPRGDCGGGSDVYRLGRVRP